MMKSDQLDLVRATFARLEAVASVAALTFYQRLFTADPSLRPLFQHDIEEQAKRLMLALRFIVDTLETPEVMVPALESLGRRHVTYGVREEHYDTVGRALLGMMEKVLGAAFTKEARAAWSVAYSEVAGIMKRAAATVPAAHDKITSSSLES
jgi:hemoglobin-like flavoprotein